MQRRLSLFVITLAGALAAAGATSIRPLRSATLDESATSMSPPWISIESPVNPFDPSTRGALLLVHAMYHDGVPQLGDLSGSAEGLVNGARRSVELHFDATPRPGVFALRRQWPSEGTWMLRIALQTTTALVTLDRDGRVAMTRVPTERQGTNDIPRTVARREIDSTLTAMANAVASR